MASSSYEESWCDSDHSYTDSPQIQRKKEIARTDSRGDLKKSKSRNKSKGSIISVQICNSCEICRSLLVISRSLLECNR